MGLFRLHTKSTEVVEEKPVARITFHSRVRVTDPFYFDYCGTVLDHKISQRDVRAQVNISTSFSDWVLQTHTFHEYLVKIDEPVNKEVWLESPHLELL